MALFKDQTKDQTKVQRHFFADSRLFFADRTIPCGANNSRGGVALALIMVVMLVIVPMFLVSASDNDLKAYQDLHLREKHKKMAENFGGAMIAALRGVEACTKNIQAMGFVGQPYTAMNNAVFNPKALVDFDSPTRQLGEGELASSALASEVDFLLHRNMNPLSPPELSLQSSTLKYCNPVVPDLNCPISVNAANLVVFRWQMNFQPTLFSSATGPIHVIHMIVGVDAAQKVIGCKLTIVKEQELVEDRICRTIAPTCATRGFFLAKPTLASPHSVDQSCRSASICP